MARGTPGAVASMVVGVAAAILAGSVVPSAAQEPTRVGPGGFREGVPTVLSPPRPPPETAFGAAYRRAGQPRMVLFFNRDMTDIPTSQAMVRRQDVTTTERTGHLMAREQVSPQATQAVKEESAQPTTMTSPQTEARPSPPGETAPTSQRIDIESNARVRTERRTDVTIERPPIGVRPAAMDEGSQWQFESAFTRRLATERVRMVDRATAVRISIAARSIADPQQLEIAAIREHAEIAILVRASPMPAVTGGLIFRVTALDVRRGTILADEIITPPASTEAASVPSVSGDLAGAALMGRLLVAWTPPR